MKKSTLIGFFVGLLALTMNAQVTQPSNSTTPNGTTKTEVQQKPSSSIQDLLVRYNNVGKYSGDVSDHFSKEEQQTLRSYFYTQNSVKTSKLSKYVSLNNSAEARGITYSASDRAAESDKKTSSFDNDAKDKSAQNAIQPLEKSLFGTYNFSISTSGVEGKVSFNPSAGTASSQVVGYKPAAPVVITHSTTQAVEAFNSVACGTGGVPAENSFYRAFDLSADFGITDDFIVSSAEFGVEESSGPTNLTINIYSTSAGFPTGYPGNATLQGTASYVSGAADTGLVVSVPVTATIPAGEIMIYELKVNAGNTAIWFPGSNSDPETDLTYIMALDCSIATPTPTAGIGFPDMHMVMNIVGEEDTGGGGGGVACAQDHPFGASGGGSGSSVDSDFKTAADIVVVAGEDFTLDTIEVPFLTFAPLDAPITANVVYYANAGGLPGAMIGSETVVPTIVSSGPWVNPVAFQFITSLAVTPFTFEGNASSDTTYWIEISMGTATNQGTVFWEYTSDIPVEGEAYAKFDATAGIWEIDEPTQEVIYNFSGECEPMTGGGPGPLSTVYGINNDDLSLIGFGVNTPGNTEVFGTSPVTVNFENAGAIDPANPTTGYVLDSEGDFYSFDVTTGVYTALGSIPGIDWTGMEYDRASGVLYAINTTELYTIDPVAVTSTLVGPLGLSADALPIALAIDGAGVGYTYDLDDDNLYSIDLATGTTTLIGYIGFTANFGQGMCYDPTTDMVYMAAFNGDAFAAEWRSVDTATGNTTLIGPILVEDSDPQVGWASVGETLPPPACPEPTDLTVSNIEPTTVDLNWVAEPNASNGYIWYVFETGADPITATPVATGTTAAGTTIATATGLSSGLSYDFYVVADCASDGLSKLAGPVTFATEVSCGGKFYDTGGPNANYDNNANETTVISPEVPTDYVTVTFTAFDVEANWDALYVYDGPDASSPIISSGNPATNSGFPAGGYYGTTIPGPFSSTHPSGALTFVFRSESSVAKAGWEADVTCTPTPPPNDMIVNSIDVDGVGFPYTDPAVNMPGATFENGNPAGCDLTGANGVWYNFVSEGDGQANATIMTPAGASSVTFYTAPNENAEETDLTLVPQNSNQCGPGTTSSIYTMAGQAYYVFVLNTGGITDIVIDGINLGVAENTIEGFSYYPNPTSDILNLKSVENIESVSLYSLLGQRVIDTRIEATTSQVDLSGLSIGTYLMKVTVNGQTATYRVLKQ